MSTIRDGCNQSAQLGFHFSLLLNCTLRLTRNISVCLLELAAKLRNSVTDGFRLEHRMLQPGQQFFFQPVLSDLEAIRACPSIEVLRTSVASISSAASPRHDYQISAAIGTFHGTAEQILA